MKAENAESQGKQLDKTTLWQGFSSIWCITLARSRPIRRFIASRGFELISTAVMLLNVIAMIVRLHYSARLIVWLKACLDLEGISQDYA
eukprot:193345-Amphidinium_carterae.1